MPAALGQCRETLPAEEQHRKPLPRTEGCSSCCQAVKICKLQTSSVLCFALPQGSRSVGLTDPIQDAVRAQREVSRPKQKVETWPAALRIPVLLSQSDGVNNSFRSPQQRGRQTQTSLEVKLRLRKTWALFSIVRNWAWCVLLLSPTVT